MYVLGAATATTTTTTWTTRWRSLLPKLCLPFVLLYSRLDSLRLTRTHSHRSALTLRHTITQTGKAPYLCVLSIHPSGILHIPKTYYIKLERGVGSSVLEIETAMEMGKRERERDLENCSACLGGFSFSFRCYVFYVHAFRQYSPFVSFLIRHG